MATKVPKIFVSNIPWTVGKKQLKKHFEKFGPVKLAMISYDWSTGISKGFGFVQFENMTSHDEAVKNVQQEIDGGIILLKIKTMGEICNDVSEELEAKFNNASSYVKSIIPQLTNTQMLEFYGLYKQATEGPCSKPKPSWYKVSEKMKWESWSSLKDLESDKAMALYVNLLDSIEPQWEEKPVKNQNGWVHHSSMKNDEEVIKDSKKTIFDWVKEKNLKQVKASWGGFASDINKLDDSGLSLLHWASDRGSLDIVKYMVETLNADVNVKDGNGQTPLHYAVSCEYDDVAEYLIKAGADVSLTDNEGKTPYDA